METTKLRVKDYVRSIDERAERRYFTGALSFAEVEENGVKSKDENIIEGYAAVFNKDSEDFGGWVEQIAPRAFSDVLNDDVVALFNHSMNHIFGRNKINLELIQDNVGLKYRVKMPDTTLAQDVRKLVKAEIIYKSSFAFTVKEERFIKGKDGKPNMRIIDKIERLYDVSPVTIPAYPDTSVAARSMEKISGKDEISEALRLIRRRKTLTHRTRHASTIF